jgi:deoxycytidine triphosphate deaminase
VYLTDRELQARLPEFQFESEFAEHPFDSDVQIGPCSVDLRLGSAYWKPRRGRLRTRVVDLEKTRLMELRPHRGWRRFGLRADEKLTLRPREMVLARVAERFRMPSDCAGSIEGRSSYARLGLSVHACGGFINPGWRGHMPLTLINHSPVTLRIPAGTPLCQLMVVPLSGQPLADYDERTDRKYVNDQGGPSYWWRDTLVVRLRKVFSTANIGTHVFDDLDELLADSPDDSILERMEDYVVRRNYAFGNAQELLDGFARREIRSKRVRETVTIAMQTGWTAFGILAGILWASHVDLLLKLGATALAVLAMSGIYFGSTREKRDFLVPARVRELEQQADARRKSAELGAPQPPTLGSVSAPAVPEPSSPAHEE